MRLGIVAGQGGGSLPELAARVALAEALGFDLVWLQEPEPVAPLVVAAALAPATSSIRIAASFRVGAHPLHIAEDAAVADQLLNGRLVLALGHDDEALLAETIDALFAAFAPRPFLHEGSRWRIPANLPGHDDVEHRLRLTPTTAQLEPTVWLTGAAAPHVARERAVSHVTGADERRLPGAGAARLRRPALRRVAATDDGSFDADALVAALRDEQAAWGLDIAVLELPPLAVDAHERALRALASAVRPRLQLDALPPGLEESWRQ